jgi:hypothetical protein
MEKPERCKDKPKKVKWKESHLTHSTASSHQASVQPPSFDPHLFITPNPWNQSRNNSSQSWPSVMAGQEASLSMLLLLLPRLDHLLQLLVLAMLLVSSQRYSSHHRLHLDQQWVQVLFQVWCHWVISSHRCCTWLSSGW